MNPTTSVSEQMSTLFPLFCGTLGSLLTVDGPWMGSGLSPPRGWAPGSLLTDDLLASCSDAQMSLNSHLRALLTLC